MGEAKRRSGEIDLQKKAEQMGRYNVHVMVVYQNDLLEEYDVFSWTDVGEKLALNISPGMFRVIPLNGVRHFTITPQQGVKEELDA